MSYNNTTSSGAPTGVHSFGTASRAFIWAAFFAIMCISIVGNSLVIWVIVAHTKMRIITNFFLLNLSISDLMVVTLQVVPNVIYTLEQNWKFGLFYCRVSNFMTTFSISLSVFTFMAIAIERYVVIMHPLRPRPKRLAIIASIAFIWAFSMVTAAPPAIFSELQVNEKMFTNCNIAAKVFVAYNYVLMTLQYLVPVIVVGIAYIIIGIRLWTQQPIGEQTQAQEETVKAKRKIVLMMITVVVIFALCWLPYQISFFFSNNSAALFIALYFLAICSTWPNPFIYCKMNNNFRTGFKQAFRFLPCVKADPEQYALLKLGRAKGHTVHSYSRAANRCQQMSQRQQQQHQQQQQQQSVALLSRDGNEAPDGGGKVDPQSMTHSTQEV